jgi:hypothetical protein
MTKRLSTAPFHVQYLGDELVRLGRAGLFQPGTTAWVDAASAEAARLHGDFVVTGPGLGALAEQVLSEIADSPTAPEPVAPMMPPPPPTSQLNAPQAAVAPATAKRPSRKRR